ncbi:MAG: chain-length determining protein [Rhodothalassiaceae bacterium]|nr:MAG: chain-length determining protein [Rhodothalassiaceae bacterium]
MHELYQNVLLMLYALWRRRWYGLAVTYVVCALGWTYIALIPNTYRSQARIYVDTESLLRPLMRGMTVDVDVFRQLDLLRQTIVNTENLERIIRRTDMDILLGAGDDLAPLIADLRSKIQISTPGENIFVLSYEASFPQLSDEQNARLARDVVAQVLNIFKEAHLGLKREDIEAAKAFINSKIQDLERKLEEAERRRAEFRRQNMGLLSSQGSYLARVEKLRDELKAKEDELADARLSRDELARQLKDIPAYLPASASGEASGGFNPRLQARIEQLQQRLDELKVRGFTDQHPDVVFVQRQLDTLKEQMEEERRRAEEALKADPETPPEGNFAPNPVWQELKVKLVDAETQVTRLTAQRDKLKRELEQLESEAGRIPLLEAELKRLDRDYDVLRENYEDLVKRREQAALSQDLEASAKNVGFEVIDPPSLPSRPYRPDRPQLLSLVLAAGLLSGVGIAFVLSQLRPVFLSSERLAETFGLPVFGVVTLVVLERDRRQYRLEVTGFLASLALLLIGYVSLLGLALASGALL